MTIRDWRRAAITTIIQSYARLYMYARIPRISTHGRNIVHQQIRIMGGDGAHKPSAKRNEVCRKRAGEGAQRQSVCECA